VSAGEILSGAGMPGKKIGPSEETARFTVHNWR